MNNKEYIIDNVKMRNIRIQKEDWGTHDIYVIVSDSKRFGDNTVIYETSNLKEVKEWIKQYINLKDCSNYNSFSHNKIPYRKI